MNNVYQFTLILDGVDEQTPNIEDALFEAGCDDALINYKNGTVYLDFDRERQNLELAIISAINTVEAANLGATILTEKVTTHPFGQGHAHGLGHVNERCAHL